MKKIAIIFVIAIIAFTCMFYFKLSSNQSNGAALSDIIEAKSDPNWITTREVSAEELSSATDKLYWKSFELSFHPVYVGAYSSVSSRGHILEINVNDSWHELSLDRKMQFVNEKRDSWYEITKTMGLGIPKNQIIVEIRHLKSHRILAGYNSKQGVYISRE
jgi:hypothetical protein